MVPREFLTVKPQLKSQVCGRNDNAKIKPANVKFVSFAEPYASFLFEQELMLFNAFQVALYYAQFGHTGCYPIALSAVVSLRWE